MQIILHYFHFCRLFTISHFFSSLFFFYSFKNYYYIIQNFSHSLERKSCTINNKNVVCNMKYKHIFMAFLNKRKIIFHFLCVWAKRMVREKCSNVPKYSWLVKFSSKLFSLFLCKKWKKKTAIITNAIFLGFPVLIEAQNKINTRKKDKIVVRSGRIMIKIFNLSIKSSLVNFYFSTFNGVRSE